MRWMMGAGDFLWGPYDCFPRGDGEMGNDDLVEAGWVKGWPWCLAVAALLQQRLLRDEHLDPCGTHATRIWAKNKPCLEVSVCISFVGTYTLPVPDAQRKRERERDRQRHKDLDLPNPRKFTEFWEATSFLLSKTMSNWSKLFTWLNFLEVQWLVDVAGYKVSACMWIYFQFLTFKNAKNYPQNSCNVLQQVSNSRKKSQTPANPKKSCNRIV